VPYKAIGARGDALSISRKQLMARWLSTLSDLAS
jgi:hypothetical protein